MVTEYPLHNAIIAGDIEPALALILRVCMCMRLMNTVDYLETVTLLRKREEKIDVIEMLS